MINVAEKSSELSKLAQQTGKQQFYHDPYSNTLIIASPEGVVLQRVGGTEVSKTQAQVEIESQIAKTKVPVTATTYATPKITPEVSEQIAAGLQAQLKESYAGKEPKPFEVETKEATFTVPAIFTRAGKTVAEKVYDAPYEKLVEYEKAGGAYGYWAKQRLNEEKVEFKDDKGNVIFTAKPSISNGNVVWSLSGKVPDNVPPIIEAKSPEELGAKINSIIETSFQERYPYFKPRSPEETNLLIEEFWKRHPELSKEEVKKVFEEAMKPEQQLAYFAPRAASTWGFAPFGEIIASHIFPGASFETQKLYHQLNIMELAYMRGRGGPARGGGIASLKKLDKWGMPRELWEKEAKPIAVEGAVTVAAVSTGPIMSKVLAKTAAAQTTAGFAARVAPALVQGTIAGSLVKSSFESIMRNVEKYRMSTDALTKAEAITEISKSSFGFSLGATSLRTAYHSLPRETFGYYTTPEGVKVPRLGMARTMVWLKGTKASPTEIEEMRASGKFTEAELKKIETEGITKSAIEKYYRSKVELGWKLYNQIQSGKLKLEDINFKDIKRLRDVGIADFTQKWLEKKLGDKYIISGSASMLSYMPKKAIPGGVNDLDIFVLEGNGVDVARKFYQDLPSNVKSKIVLEGNKIYDVHGNKLIEFYNAWNYFYFHPAWGAQMKTPSGVYITSPGEQAMRLIQGSHFGVGLFAKVKAERVEKDVARLSAMANYALGKVTRAGKSFVESFPSHALIAGYYANSASKVLHNVANVVKKYVGVKPPYPSKEISYAPYIPSLSVLQKSYQPMYSYKYSYISPSYTQKYSSSYKPSTSYVKAPYAPTYTPSYAPTYKPTSYYPKYPASYQYQSGYPYTYYPNLNVGTPYVGAPNMPFMQMSGFLSKIKTNIKVIHHNIAEASQLIGKAYYPSINLGNLGRIFANVQILQQIPKRITFENQSKPKKLQFKVESIAMEHGKKEKVKTKVVPIMAVANRILKSAESSAKQKRIGWTKAEKLEKVKAKRIGAYEEPYRRVNKIMSEALKKMKEVSKVAKLV